MTRKFQELAIQSYKTKNQYLQGGKKPQPPLHIHCYDFGETS